MTLTFDSEVSLHSWLLWPKVQRHGCSLTAEPNWGLEQKVLPDIISHTVYTLAHSEPPVLLLWEMMISVWFWLEMPQKMATCLVRVIYVWN